MSAEMSWQYDHYSTVCPWPCGYGSSSSWRLVCTNCRSRRAGNRAHGWAIKTGWGEKQVIAWSSICYLQLTENGRRFTIHFSKIHSTLMLKSRIESKSGKNKNWKASPQLFDGTIRSFGTDDRPSTGLWAVNTSTEMMKKVAWIPRLPASGRRQAIHATYVGQAILCIYFYFR